MNAHGSEKDHLDVEEQEEQRDDVEFHREPGMPQAAPVDTAFVRRVLDLVLPGALAEEMARSDDRGRDSRGQDDLIEEWQIGGGGHRD